MVKRMQLFVRRGYALSRISMALSRAAATSQLRKLDPRYPTSWQFCGFSQNNEDGIIDYLTSKIPSPNRYFVEIGAADGIENNTAWLAVAKRYSGLMIEGNEKLAKRASDVISWQNVGVKCINAFIDRDNAVALLKEQMCHEDPDVFSLDIDGNDWYVAQAILEAGIRPKIFVVEYNSTFGPERSITIKYEKDFDYRKKHETHLYFGASISAFRKLFSQFNYRFVTVEQNGANAFFIDGTIYDDEFISGLNGLAFAENYYHRVKFCCGWKEQFSKIQHLEYVEI